MVIMTSTLDKTSDRAWLAGALACLKKPSYSADIDAVPARYYGPKMALA